MKNKQLTLLATVVSLMFVLGYIFEIVLPFGFLATYVNPTPAEGLLIFVIIVVGIKAASMIFIAYIVILFSFKGLSPLLINEIALIMSAIFTMLIFYMTYSKYKLGYMKSAIITIAVNTILMTLTNAYFITPSFVKQAWTTYKIAFPEQTFTDIIKYVSIPLPTGGGIVHGNIVKYTACFALATVAQATYKHK